MVLVVVVEPPSEVEVVVVVVSVVVVVVVELTGGSPPSQGAGLSNGRHVPPMSVRLLKPSVCVPAVTSTCDWYGRPPWMV